MKTTGERFRYLREKVMNVTRHEMSVITGASTQSLANIESDAGGNRALKEIVEKLGLNAKWIETGKGPIWANGGTDEENIKRIKMPAAGAPISNDPWKDEAYQLLKSENERLRSWIDSLMKKMSFPNQPGKTSYRSAAAA